MGNGPLIGLTGHAVSRNVTKHHRQGGERHCQGKKSARLFHDGAKRIGMLIHVASAGWGDVFTKCRPNYVCRRAEPAGLKKRLKLHPVALSPVTRIKARKQVSDYAIHKASSRASPALVNCRRVVSFARRTRSPAAVMR